MRAVAACLLGALVMAAPISTRAWGMDVHRLITGRALDGLPGDLRPFLAAKREFIVEHSADPDLWRVVGLKGNLGEEDPNHFLDIDGLDEAAPFKGVPRDWNAYVARYGVDRSNRTGRLPWRAEEVDALLVKAFQAIGSGTAAYAADNSRYLIAVLSHYVEDAHVPFHAVLNYDGQLTNQRGIHARFETELVLRHADRLAWSPVRVHAVPNVRDFVFEALVESQSQVTRILDADRAAAAGRELYDDGYYAAMFEKLRPLVEARLNDSASAVASVIVSAWERGGKPKLPLATTKSPARIIR